MDASDSILMHNGFEHLEFFKMHITLGLHNLSDIAVRVWIHDLMYHLLVKPYNIDI